MYPTVGRRLSRPEHMVVYQLVKVCLQPLSNVSSTPPLDDDAQTVTEKREFILSV